MHNRLFAIYSDTVSAVSIGAAQVMAGVSSSLIQLEQNVTCSCTQLGSSKEDPILLDSESEFSPVSEPEDSEPEDSEAEESDLSSPLKVIKKERYR